MGSRFCTRKETMITRTITYEDFDGNEVTETLNFNLNTQEVFEMMGIEVGDEGEAISKMADLDPKQISVVMGTISQLILDAYGQRSEDGKRFIKTPEMKEAFSQSAAYDAIFSEVAMDDVTAGKFLEGILPKKLLAEMKRLEIEKPKQGA